MIILSLHQKLQYKLGQCQAFKILISYTSTVYSIHVSVNNT